MVGVPSVFVLMPNNKTLLVLLWFCSTVIFAIGGAAVLNVRKFYALSKRGIHTDARVTKLEPSNHNAVYYSYDIDHISYSGAGSASNIGRKGEAMVVGDMVSIAYDPVSPASSCLGDPNDQLESLIHGVMFISVFPTVFFFVFYLRKRSPKSETASRNRRITRR